MVFKWNIKLTQHSDNRPSSLRIGAGKELWFHLISFSLSWKSLRNEDNPINPTPSLFISLQNFLSYNHQQEVLTAIIHLLNALILQNTNRNTQLQIPINTNRNIFPPFCLTSCSPRWCRASLHFASLHGQTNPVDILILLILFHLSLFIYFDLDFFMERPNLLVFWFDLFDFNIIFKNFILPLHGQTNAVDILILGFRSLIYIPFLHGLVFWYLILGIIGIWIFNFHSSSLWQALLYKCI